MYRIVVVIAPSALLRAQDGLDLRATADAFIEAVRGAATRDLVELRSGEATLELRYELTLASHTIAVDGPDDLVCRRIERDMRDLVWVVRECVPFAVLTQA